MPFGYLIPVVLFGLATALSGVAVVVMGGLIVLIRRGQRTAGAVRRALADAGIPAAPRRRWPWLRIVIAPYGQRRRDVTRVANLRYGDAGRRNLLDVYHHRRSRPAGAPILIHLPPVRS